MIVNHSRQFVFVHIPKTAGTSVRNALLAAPGSKNASKKTKHQTADEFLGSRKWWHRSVEGYIFFAFVRNPWDRFLSLHRYLQAMPVYKDRTPKAFSAFVAALAAREPWLMALHSIRPQTDFLKARSSSLVGRYENLASDFASICEALELRLNLPHLNATAKQGNYRHSYSDTDAEVIGRYYKCDLDRFGYAFDGHTSGGNSLMNSTTLG